MVVVTVMVGGGVTEVIAILLAAYSAKHSLFPRIGEINTHNTRTNKYTNSPQCLNTAGTYCKSPHAFGYSLMYTPYTAPHFKEARYDNIDITLFLHQTKKLHRFLEVL